MEPELTKRTTLTPTPTRRKTTRSTSRQSATRPPLTLPKAVAERRTEKAPRSSTVS